MSERGVFAVDRGWFDHPTFKPEPFTEREAWIWLIAEAAFRAHRRRVGSVTVTLTRGQLAHSLRFMADKWRWKEPRVRRFLARLKEDAMIDAASDAGVTVITICNYSKYQRVSLPIDAASDAGSDAPATQLRRKEEDTKDTKEQQQTQNLPPCRAVASATRTDRDKRFEEFWKSYPKRLGANPKAPARKLFVGFIKSGVDPDAIIEGARRCATADARKVGTEYIPQAVKWLRDRRWEDYSATGPPQLDFNTPPPEYLEWQKANGHAQ